MASTASYLDKIVADGLMGLFPIPGAAIFPPQDAHDGEKIFDGICFFKTRNQQTKAGHP